MKYKNQIRRNGFGIAESIVSISLLFGIIIYSVYFSSLRFSNIYRSNLIRSINKEIERDIEKLKLAFWSIDYDQTSKSYKNDISYCNDFTEKIINLENWNIDPNTKNIYEQTWIPGPERSKIFKGENIKISRVLNINYPKNIYSLNKSIASINYRVQLENKNLYWLSIELIPESHSWCQT
tara:strand:- start:341 stop:880 length:540 start_codon:yes stop_codon:yes gene_type:complete